VTEHGLFPDKQIEGTGKKFIEISYFSVNMIKVLDFFSKRWNMINLMKEEYVLPEWFDDISSFKNNDVLLKLNDKWQIFNLAKKEYVLPEWFDDITTFENNNILLKLNEKLQIYNFANKEYIIPEWVDEIKKVDNNNFHIIVRNFNKWNIVSIKHKKYVMEKWGEEVMGSRSILIGNKWHLINLNSFN